MKRQKTVDRRVQRTRRLLQDALVATVIEKGYEAATVQDIIDRADVGRATFYAHFADKQTLLTSRLEDQVLNSKGGPSAATTVPRQPRVQPRDARARA